MGLNAGKADKPTGGAFEIMDAGTYPCRLVGLIDLGLQPQQYMGKPKDPRQEVMLTWEFTDEFMKGDDGEDDETKPRWLSESMPLHHPDVENAKSTARLNALDPNGDAEGDFTRLLGVPVYVSVVHNPKGDKVYENVAEVSAMRAKDQKRVAELVNPTLVFDLDDPDLEAFERLPQWVRTKITKNLEYAGSKLEKLIEAGPKKEAKAAAKPKKDRSPPKQDDLDDEIPF